MKNLLLTFGLVLATLTGFSQENENAAEITFEQETIDYGTIERGADGNREFVFTNTGKEPLIITNCQGSCGCTVPTWPREPIAPGESAVIKVKYDTKRKGSFTKSVTVSSNAKNGKKTVRIKGTVKDVPQPKTTPVKESTSMLEEK